MDKFSVLMTMIPALPLVAACLCALAGPRLLRQYCHIPVILCLAGSFVGSFLLFLEVRSGAVQFGGRRPIRRRVRSRHPLVELGQRGGRTARLGSGVDERG